MENAILDRFTDLHPLRKPDSFDFARKHAEQSKRDSKFSFGYKNGNGLLSRQLRALDLGYFKFSILHVLAMHRYSCKRLDMSACDNKLGSVTID